MSKKMKFFGTMLIALAVVGCTKPDADDNTNVDVKTYTPTDITSTSASCGGDAIVDGNVSLTELGVCWSTSSNPTPADNKQSTEVCNQPYVCTIAGLTPNTKYHVRAFAFDGTKYYYGEDKSFTTESSGGGGGNNTDYAALLHSSVWSGPAPSDPSNEELYVEFVFDRPENGNMNFVYGTNFTMLLAKGTYTISGNVITTTYTYVELSQDSYYPWVYGHTYGFVEGQNKTVTYTIQSCTSDKLIVKESSMGDTFTMTKWQQ